MIWAWRPIGFLRRNLPYYCRRIEMRNGGLIGIFELRPKPYPCCHVVFSMHAIMMWSLFAAGNNDPGGNVRLGFDQNPKRRIGGDLMIGDVVMPPGRVLYRTSIAKTARKRLERLRCSTILRNPMFKQHILRLLELLGRKFNRLINWSCKVFGRLCSSLKLYIASAVANRSACYTGW